MRYSRSIENIWVYGPARTSFHVYGGREQADKQENRDVTKHRIEQGLTPEMILCMMEALRNDFGASRALAGPGPSYLVLACSPAGTVLLE